LQPLQRFFYLYRYQNSAGAMGTFFSSFAGLFRRSSSANAVVNLHPQPNIAEAATATPGQYKVVLLGDSGVGKTALLTRFKTGRFPERQNATVGMDWHYSEHTVPRADDRGERTVTLKVWDTCGFERFRATTRSFLKGAQAVILFFRVDEPDSLQHAYDTWFRMVQEEFGDGLPLLVLVGTCEDLRRRPGDADDAHTYTTPTDIGRWQEAVRASEYIPTSAMNGYNVHTVFQNVAVRCALAAPIRTPAPAADVGVDVGDDPIPPAPYR